LLERILAQTSGDPSQMIPVGMRHAGFAGATLAPAQEGGVPALTPGYAMPGGAGAYGNVIPFRQRMRASAFGQIFLQPRLAMTAAMAFFSIALTMNLTGVHLQDLHASDLTPSNLKRGFYSANARVVRYYEGLRVVYELESRVHDLQTATDNDAAAGSPSAEPIASPNPQANPSDGKAPTAQPGQTDPANGSPAARPIRNSGSLRQGRDPLQHQGPRRTQARAGARALAIRSTAWSGSSSRTLTALTQAATVLTQTATAKEWKEAWYELRKPSRP
jgi:hypothetical protein